MSNADAATATGNGVLTAKVVRATRWRLPLILLSARAMSSHPMTGTAHRLGQVSRSVSMTWRRRRPVVLMYHGFTRDARDDDPENMFVTVTDFERQLDHLLDHGWEPLDLRGFLATLTGDKRGKSFLLTIDDGLDSVAELAAPALRARSVPAVVFVPAGLVGATADWLPHPPGEPIMDRERLQELSCDGLVEIGAHGFEHNDMRGLDSRQLARQTTQACQVLHEITGAPIRAFAYPYGAHDASAREAVAQAGCLVGFSVFEDETRFAISRVDVNATDTLASFRLKLTPGYRTWWRAAGRTAILRRFVRRLIARRSGASRRPHREA